MLTMLELLSLPPPADKRRTSRKKRTESARLRCTWDVGNLHYDIVSEDLAKLLEQAGVVEFSEVIYSRGTGQSRGYGFVTMSTVKEAELAVEMFDGFRFRGMLLIVRQAALRGARVETPSHQSKSPFRIYVGNLPSQIDDSWLEELFNEHGNVVDARVVYERRGGTWSSQGFGFVTMATEEEMYDAIYALNKKILEGCALRVEVAKERPRRGLY